jgi:hypothetical protein
MAAPRSYPMSGRSRKVIAALQKRWRVLRRVDRLRNQAPPLAERAQHSCAIAGHLRGEEVVRSAGRAEDGCPA